MIKVNFGLTKLEVYVAELAKILRRQLENRF